MRNPDATPERAPRIATDTMRLCLPNMQDVARRIARRFRSRLGEQATVRREDVEDDAELGRFLTSSAEGGMLVGCFSRRAAAQQAALLANHLLYFINFEYHRRKVFWTSPPLAWMLARTRLDIDGELLKPPFASCAFVFTDPESLALAEALLEADEPDWLHRTGSLKAVAAHVTETKTSVQDTVGLDVDLLLDQHLPGEWPILYSRNLVLRPRDRLDASLDSVAYIPNHFL